VSREEPTQVQPLQAAAGQGEGIIASPSDDGVAEDQMTGAPARPSRSGEEVGPGDSSAHATGEQRAQRNREEDPPA
jgi:hypothetical protein